MVQRHRLAVLSPVGQQKCLQVGTMRRNHEAHEIKCATQNIRLWQDMPWYLRLKVALPVSSNFLIAALWAMFISPKNEKKKK